MNTNDHADESEISDFIFICPSNLECVLAAGDSGDIAALQEWCAALPKKSYGCVYIEVDSPEQMQTLDTPPGVVVTWLIRSSPESLVGERLMEAVNAWLDEWLRGDPLSGRYVHLWTGARTSREVTEQWSRIEAELAETWTAATEYREYRA